MTPDAPRSLPPGFPEWARDLDLAAHPEGGWYAETYRSPLTVGSPPLPGGYDGDRALATAILFLLLPGETSAWHRVRSDELWFHQRGGPLLLSIGGSDDDAGPGAGPGSAGRTDLVLGTDTHLGQVPQALVPAGRWQCARPAEDRPVLVGCVVSPGFDFRDFRLLGA